MGRKAHEIAELESRLKKLKAEEKAFEEQTPEQKLAEILHEKLCNWDHTEGCGWFYDTWESAPKQGPHNSRNAYLKKAKKILTIVDYNTAIRILDEL